MKKLIGNRALLALLSGTAHAAWYLLDPPTSPKGDVAINDPLWNWQQIGSFDTAAQCEGTQDQLRDWARGPADYTAIANARQAAGKVVSHRTLIAKTAESLCVSTDDPRLNV